MWCILEGGDKIPADIRFIDASSAYVDESSLTGESVPVQKSTQPIAGDNLVPGDQRNMGFSGTYLTQGTARGLVVETGANTDFGRIADMVKSADSGQTPLQRKMSEFVHTLIKAILAVGAFNFVYGLYLGYDMGYSFLGAVSLVVAAIPEMLPALVTAILAVSGTIMASRKALIRKLPAVETLGATSVICSDKTGTLTENRDDGHARPGRRARPWRSRAWAMTPTGHVSRTTARRLDAETHHGPARAAARSAHSATTPI
ncbi:MAG: HAD-IC family P-type ATPase [Chromatiales bacterium]|nr:HAD-IC family P-type ATPase [Chromatiales bacterium]